MGMIKKQAVSPTEVAGDNMGFQAPPFFPAPPAEQSIWDKKDRAQLVGGRSHDAASLVNTALVTGTPLAEVLMLYKEALVETLKLGDEVK